MRMRMYHLPILWGSSLTFLSFIFWDLRNNFLSCQWLLDLHTFPPLDSRGTTGEERPARLFPGFISHALWKARYYHPYLNASHSLTHACWLKMN